MIYFSYNDLQNIYFHTYDIKWHMTGKSINKPFWVVNVMIYLFGVTKHIKYVMPMMYTC